MLSKNIKRKNIHNNNRKDEKITKKGDKNISKNNKNTRKNNQGETDAFKKIDANKIDQINETKVTKHKKRNIKGEEKSRKKELTEEEKARKKRRKRICLICAIIILIIGLITFLISLFKWNRIIKDVITCKNSVVLDSTGNVIAVLGESRIQEVVPLNKIPQDLIDAYVSIEDKNFYKHHGINVKRTAGAIGSYIIHKGSASYGGSTITQQLIKNVTGENESSATRKLVEFDRAIKTELLLSKDQIMQTYLNIIYVGPNVYGVEMGAKYYFNKDVSELELVECAFLAGLNHSPNSYNPFGDRDNSGKIHTRTKTVLDVMLSEKYISDSEYNEAINKLNKGLNFEKGDVKSKGDGVYSYMVDATISDAIADLEKNKKISTTFATNYLYFSGLKIYCTQNSDIQKDMENEFSKNKYKIKSSKSKGTTTQAAMIIIDHENGQVKGCVGGLGEKTSVRGFNRATQALRQTGSAIKPIAVLGPALEEKIITPVTIYDDTKTTFSTGYNPNNCENELGKITVRRAVESSQNIPFVKIMEQLTPQKSINYMKNQGITTITDADCDLPLALGGLEKGFSPIEMASAYATIANGGKYIEPVFYTRIENQSGRVLLKSKQKTRKIYSEDTAYILKNLLTQPVKGEHGTARNCNIEGMEVAAKTGTTNDNYDKWLCGFTKYYTAVTWFGFDESEEIKESSNSMANQIWVGVMKSVHENLIDASFDKPKNLQEVVICKETGKLATAGCKDTYIEYFRKGTVISDKCNKH